VKRIAALGLLVLAASGCGGRGDPGKAAVRVVDQIVHNDYTKAWDGLYGVDQKVAPRKEYVDCESRSPVNAVPLELKVVKVADVSVGLGNGRFVDSKAVSLRLDYADGGFVHVVHLVADGGKWRWILPSWRYRDYQADRCPTDAGSSPPPTSS
jgi:hypothetical protein